MDDKELIAALEEVLLVAQAQGNGPRCNAARGAIDRLTALADENARLRKEIASMRREASANARDAATEARWQARNDDEGVPYGTY